MYISNYKNITKKAISPVVATALLLVVSVVAVVGFQGWFTSFSSTMLNDVESDSNSFNSDLSIENVIVDSLYLRNSGLKDVEITSIEISGINCDLGSSNNISSGFFNLDLSNCDSKIPSGEHEVVVYTKDNVITKYIYIDEQVLVISKNLFFANIYGGPGSEYLKKIISTSDNSLLSAGYTRSYGAGGLDFWLVKTNLSGGMLWSKSFGGTGSEEAEDVIESSNSDYILVGDTSSYGAGAYDIWVLRLDSDGNHLWNKTFGGSSSDHIRGVYEDGNGDLYLNGYTGSYGAGSNDLWIIKLDSNGNEIWNKTYGGTGSEIFKKRGFTTTSDGNFVYTGLTTSFGAGSNDIWLLKIDTNGNHIWNKTYGSTGSDRGYGVVEVGNDLVVSGYVSAPLAVGSEDLFVFKVDSTGTMIWNKTFGDAGDVTNPRQLIKTSDGNLLTSGYKSVLGNEFLLVKYDTNGNELWNKTYGGGSDEKSESLLELPYGDIVVAGRTTTFGTGGDFWILRLNSTGGSCSYSGTGVC